VVGLVFVALLLAFGPLPAAVADQSFTTYFSAGALGGLALLGGNYLAEVARARSLRRHGTPAEGIMLTAFGGQLVGATPPETPQTLRRFAWAGPVALLLCAVIAGAVAAGFATGSGSAPRLLAVTAGWVGGLLGMFALIELLPRPGAPGGQLIAARAWRRTGDRSAGELATARAGVRAGWTVGIVAALATVLVSPLAIWLLPVAFITVMTSKAALAGATLRRQVSAVSVRDVMTPAPPTTLAWSTVDAALAELPVVGLRPPALIVQDVDGVWAGVAPLPVLLAVPGDDRDTTRVRQVTVARDQVATVPMTATVEEALDQLTARPMAGLVVVLDDERNVAGLLSAFDIARLGGVQMPQWPGQGSAPGSGPLQGKPPAPRSPF
jgi:Zn-dependent protease